MGAMKIVACPWQNKFKDAVPGQVFTCQGQGEALYMKLDDPEPRAIVLRSSSKSSSVFQLTRFGPDDNINFLDCDLHVN